jgi:glyoxylase-like metal-dependent hydrolase (beta-lactamase superfamily II)
MRAPNKRIVKMAVTVTLLCALYPLLIGCGRVDLEKTGLVKLSGRVYAFVASGPAASEGLGANSGFVVGNEGVLVVDSRYTPKLARQLLDAIRSVTDLPVWYVVNTHYHPDHVWGNSVFKEEGAVIVSHTEARADIEKYSPLYFEYYRDARKDAYEQLKDVSVVIPDTTFDDELSIDLGGFEIMLRHFGPGHTAGDCVVFIPKEKVVFTGGLAANGYHPNLGDEGADFDNWIATLIRLGKMDLRYIIPALGFVSGPEVLETCRAYFETLRDQCRDEIRKGNYVQVAAVTIKVPGTEGYLQENLLPFNVQAVYLHEVVDVLKPDFTFDLPEGFKVADGGAEGKGGRIKWLQKVEDGTLEIEVHWNPSNRGEVLVQDIHDRVDRYLEANVGKLSMETAGEKKLEIGGMEAPAVFGTYRLSARGSQVGAGIWTWSMLVRGGDIYSIQLQTDAMGRDDRERENMELLERIAGTFRLTSV